MNDQYNIVEKGFEQLLCYGRLQNTASPRSWSEKNLINTPISI